jgi:Glycosyltransferase like family 2
MVLEFGFGVLTVVATFFATCISIVPGTILLIEVMAALLPRRKPPGGVERTNVPRTAILIPAHNEASQIGITVRSLLPELGSTDRMIVVADNCSDDTAALARAAGSAAIERRDADQRGKGFAIAFGLAHLDADPPEIVMIVDADCRVSAGGIATLARLAARTNRPVQAEYLMGSPSNANPMTVISALAILLRNRVRPLGLHRLGLPCHLMGSGMAFPWRVLRDAPETGANLVEDLVMGIEMALRDHDPLWCPAVQITSELPDGRIAATSQRKRWEHGQLHTLATYVPRLIVTGVGRGRPALVGLGLDLMVPPLALLGAVQVLLLTLMVGSGAMGLTTYTPAVICGIGICAATAAVVVSWLKFGRRTIPLRYALFIPFYVLWKIPLYFSLLVRGKQKTWERTPRSVQPEGDGIESVGARDKPTSGSTPPP